MEVDDYQQFLYKNSDTDARINDNWSYSKNRATGASFIFV